LGLAFSLTDVYYRMDAGYDETFKNNGGFLLTNYLQTEGSAFQLDLGAIWRPVDFLRLGIAYHSPVWYSMHDFFRGDIKSDIDNGQAVNTPDGNFEYRFRSPYEWVFSAAAVLGTEAIVSVDYEIKDYRGMDFEYQNGQRFRDNEYIDTDFKSASTLRAGLEYRFTPQFSGRLGYSWMQHPYEQKFKDNLTEVITSGTIPHYTIEGDVNYLTAGIGYRFTPSFYIDAAFIYRTQTDDLYFFPQMETNRLNYIEDQPDTHNKFSTYSPIAASLKNVSFKGLVTLGYKF
jgi:long-subunit fatty acid transport protein